MVVQNAAGFDMVAADVFVTGDCTGNTSGASTLVNGAKQNFGAFRFRARVQFADEFNAIHTRHVPINNDGIGHVL